MIFRNDEWTTDSLLRSPQSQNERQLTISSDGREHSIDCFCCDVDFSCFSSKKSDGRDG